MKLIVAVDSNWGIGLRNALLVHIPSDMKFSAVKRWARRSSWEERHWKASAGTAACGQKQYCDHKGSGLSGKGSGCGTQH